ncbi:hypothetical protein J7F01_08575 [Streptomyces sp. ISL-22]|uniref:hypothetical protein n=1 Tax=unclassified Streptomyces TaxID=2593676 RepID=UPI001BE86E18|nr:MULTISPECIES: hypothetical protein [unclassified Streptomyces]MBT2418069.1 hypothetical protein [Streptomyces sp. ISL-24]MBT2432256.1 hypothetical protein [Streptomyces sp. ISL-22]
MPGTDMPQHPTVVHQILQHAHALLTASDKEEDPPLVELLTRAADHVPAEEREHLDSSALAWAVAEAAAQLLARCKIPITAGDPNAAYCLQALDRLPRTARTGLLTVAIRYTAPAPHGNPPPDEHAPVPGGQSAARDRRRGACPCPCNSGGFCGGCGHAGCGGRR